MNGTGGDVALATGIAMERYGLDEIRSFALLTRIAMRSGVAINVVALAVVAASRRRAESD